LCNSNITDTNITDTFPPTCNSRAYIQWHIMILWAFHLFCYIDKWVEVSHQSLYDPIRIAGSNPVRTARLDNLMETHQAVFILRLQALSQSLSLGFIHWLSSSLSSQKFSCTVLDIVLSYRKTPLFVYAELLLSHNMDVLDTMEILEILEIEQSKVL
jgi:hypothetical protein